MALLTTVYWRDIPAQVIVKAGRKNAKRELPQRFQEAIDIAAMRSKAHETDAYLEEWRRGSPVECGNDLEYEADLALNQLESQFTDEQLDAIAKNGGHAVD
jgi:hypothetical protein